VFILSDEIQTIILEYFLFIVKARHISNREMVV
jgi:hypothetical protein